MIRRFRIRDLRQIVKIEQESFGVDAWPRAAFIEYAETCPRLFLVAISGRSIAGYSISAVDGTRAELLSIAVSNQYRRQGIARSLLTSTLRKVKRLGATMVWLMVRSDNHDAIELYRRFGFIRRRTVRDYYEDGANRWLMELP